MAWPSLFGRHPRVENRSYLSSPCLVSILLIPIHSKKTKPKNKKCSTFFSTNLDMEFLTFTFLSVCSVANPDESGLWLRKTGDLVYIDNLRKQKFSVPLCGKNIIGAIVAVEKLVRLRRIYPPQAELSRSVSVCSVARKNQCKSVSIRV